MQKNSGKEIKLRHCISCRAERHKREFLRIVKSPEGEYFIDESGKANGRGAYLCKLKKCAQEMKKRRQLDRSFKTKVPQEVYEKVLAAAEEFDDE